MKQKNKSIRSTRSNAQFNFPQSQILSIGDEVKRGLYKILGAACCGRPARGGFIPALDFFLITNAKII